MPNESTGAAPAPVDPHASASAAQLSPVERARLQQCFNRGTQNAPTNLDYAIEMYTICVIGDPGNAVYLQALLGVLRRKHGPRKGGGLSALWATGSRTQLKKHAANAQWRDVIKAGVEIIKANPADHTCLLAMAEACGNLMFFEAQGVYLKAALDAAPADIEVNKQCARYAANQGQFDQAIACWVRISNMKGMGEEAQREIARLQVEKTIVAGQGMSGRPGTTRPAAAGGGDAAAATGDRVAELKAEIQHNPAAIEAYLELADLLERDGSVDQAEQVLARALAASGNDLKVREHVEDRQLRWARHKVMIAEKRVATDDSPDTRGTLEKLKAEQLKREIDVYSARCIRYPENVIWKFELAMRLKAGGNHAEAIRHFQEVLQDPRRKGQVSLELGECFQKIKQYQLAAQNYQTAVELLTDRELELRKRALYRAGVLAAGLGDADTARKHLATLAGLDFGYRDVAQRLDKLGSGHDNNPSPE